MDKQYFNWEIPDGLTLKYSTVDTKEVLEARFIQLIAPTARSIKSIAPIKQMFTRAVMSMSLDTLKAPADKDMFADQTPAEDVDSPDIDSDTIISIISMSSSVEYDKFLEMCIEVVKDKHLVLIDGETPIKNSFLDHFPLYCLEALIGEYLVNFIAPSVTKT